MQPGLAIPINNLNEHLNWMANEGTRCRYDGFMNVMSMDTRNVKYEPF